MILGSLISRVGDSVKTLFGANITEVREPDRSKIAEIEAQARVEIESYKVKIKELELQKQLQAENSKIEMMKQEAIKADKIRELELQKQLQAENSKIEMMKQESIEADKIREFELQKQLQAENSKIEMMKQEAIKADKIRELELQKQLQAENSKIEMMKQESIEADKIREFELQKQLQAENSKIEMMKQEAIEADKIREFELQKLREDLAIKEKEHTLAILFEEAQTREQKLRYEIEIDKMRAIKEIEIATMNQQMELFVKTKEAMIRLKSQFEKSSLDTVAYAGALSQDLRERINNYYNELNTDLEKKNQDFIDNKLPTMLENLSKYDENSVQFKTYQKMVDSQSEKYVDMIFRRIEDFNEQQKNAIESSKELETILLSSSAKMIENSMKMLDTQIAQISTGEIVDVDIENMRRLQN